MKPLFPNFKQTCLHDAFERCSEPDAQANREDLTKSVTLALTAILIKIKLDS
jgi:hypothetical protein